MADQDPEEIGAEDLAPEVPVDGEFAELDRLYREALDAMDAVASDLSSVSQMLSSEDAVEDAEEADVIPFPGPQQADASSTENTEDAPLHVAAEDDDAQWLDYSQVIEAALFVGGSPLTSRKLCAVLGESLTPEMVDARIDRLNERYSAENRPYEVLFGEGGYRMALRPEFDRIRNRVFGLGPKEIKLTQEALEILAFVAYNQPVSRAQAEELGNPNAPSILRQLLRRELISIERSSESGSNEVLYRTTTRFLHVFGIGDLDELPQAEDLNFK